jgi:hypothetical protein
MLIILICFVKKCNRISDLCNVIEHKREASEIVLRIIASLLRRQCR